ncbi:unnamed protein product [Gongylonema pulchrum]|uniref:Uncharacterized protein n=1 Tax=Gongylonema pulchrum TaxID=637853 RepID=A0A3P6P8Z9_9BILA|nr:unnamed protein product [Gongylonema pulchrum]
MDVPLRKWNFGSPHSSGSSINMELIPLGLQSPQHAGSESSLQGKPRELGSLSGTVDASLLSKLKRKSISRERRDDNYEMMSPMSSSTILAPPRMSAEHSLRTARGKDSLEQVSPAMTAYLGVLTMSQAEERVNKPTSFKLYHLVI